MTNKTYTSVIDTEVYDNGMDYLDVNIYVTCPDGDEWRKTVSLNKRSGKLDGSVICYSEGKDTCFDEPKYHPPMLVSLMFNERYEEAKQLLRAERTRQTSVKDHAEEMLEVLKKTYRLLEDLHHLGHLKHYAPFRDSVKHMIDKVEGKK
jgi:hypothetical protein